MAPRKQTNRQLSTSGGGPSKVRRITGKPIKSKHWNNHNNSDDESNDENIVNQSSDHLGSTAGQTTMDAAKGIMSLQIKAHMQNERKENMLGKIIKDQKVRNVVTTDDQMEQILKIWVRTKLFQQVKFLTTDSMKSFGPIFKQAAHQVKIPEEMYAETWVEKHRNIVRKTLDQKRSNVDQEMKNALTRKWEGLKCLCNEYVLTML